MIDRLRNSLLGARQIKRRRASESPGYVYIIQCLTYFKIGSAIDPHRRLLLLQTGCPYELSIVRLFQVGNMIERERDLQRAFKQHHHKREWFKLSVETVDELLLLTDSEVFARKKF